MGNRATKAKYQEYHASKRLAERYGVKYTQYLHDSILCAINKNKATLVLKQSNRVSIYDVTVTIREEEVLTTTPGQCKIRVAYDSKRKTIVTALTTDMNPADQIELEEFI